MKKAFLSALALATSFALSSAASASSIVDPGFEASPLGTGTPAGWFTNNPGLVQVVNSFGAYALNASVRNVGDDGFNSYLLLDAPAVPEPGTWMLMLLGLGAVGFSMRRRHNVRVNFA